MRAVLDPNVLVSAVLSSEGPSAGLLRAARDGRLNILVSPKLLTELGDVLRRDRFRRYLSTAEVTRYLDALDRIATTVDDPEAAPPVSRDPDDDYLVALAERHQVDMLVSGDKDLTGLSLPGLRVYAPRVALDIVARGD